MSGLDTVIGGKAGNPEQVKKHLAEADRLEKAGDRAGAVRELRAANDLSDDHGVTFKLAYMLDLLGEENEAVALYTEITNSAAPSACCARSSRPIRTMSAAASSSRT
jgi:hypothetical protein